jgi:hypothetical protein
MPANPFFFGGALFGDPRKDTGEVSATLVGRLRMRWDLCRSNEIGMGAFAGVRFSPEDAADG